MRTTPASIMLSDDNWIFIIDSLIDRLENLTDLHNGPFDLDFADDIKHCESIIKAIENRIAD